MVTPSIGAVVLVPFPFSDLSQSKRRPAVVLADAGKGDFVLCQITSKPHADVCAIELTNASFAAGFLRASVMRARRNCLPPIIACWFLWLEN